MFNHWLPSNTVLQIVFDLVVLCGTMMFALSLVSRGNPHLPQQVFVYAMQFALAVMALNAALGLYQRKPGVRWDRAWARIVLALLLALPIAYATLAALRGHDGLFGSVETSVLMALGVMLGLRAYAVHRGVGPVLVRRVMVIGTGAEARAVEQSLRRFGTEVHIVGFYPAHSEGHPAVAAECILPAAGSLANVTRSLRVEEIIVAVRERRGGVVPLRDLLDCKLAGVRVLDLSTYFERVLGQVRLESLRASWLIYGEGFQQGLLRMTLKRAVDVAGSLVLLALSLPVMLATAILIRCEDGAPILYRQERVGKGGRLFHIIKFRSMRRDAELDGNPRWATSGDARITRVGRVIRRFRIDELPQLFNVLKGDMSLVGPRPERPYFVDDLTRQLPFYTARHSVKPGVTGWAQVRYQYGASTDEAAMKLQYDLYYVKNHTLFLDAVILFETVGVVLSGEGAH